MSVDLDIAGGVARIVLNRPDRRNAIDRAAEAALGGFWDRIEADPDIRCAVLTGAGRTFCAGASARPAARTRLPTTGRATRGSGASVRCWAGSASRRT